MIAARTIAIACVVSLYACDNPGEDTFQAPNVFFLNADGTELADGESIPYRAGGQFTVGVSLSIPDMAQSTRASIEIVEPSPLADAVTTAVAQLTLQGDGTFRGTTQLQWPLGGNVSLRARAAGRSMPATAPLALPTLTFHPPDFTAGQARGVVPLCLESGSPDGTVSVHLEGATLAGGSATDLSTPLVPGPCPGLTFGDPASLTHAALTATASGSFGLTATLVNSPKVLAQLVSVPNAPVVQYALAIEPLVPDAQPLTIGEIEITATADGALAPGESIQLQSAPPVTFVPANPVTDAEGVAVVRFQMPEGGAVHIQATLRGRTQSVNIP